MELIEATFWLPIGTVEVWQAAQERTDIEDERCPDNRERKAYPWVEHQASARG